MDRHTLDVLDFPRIQEILAGMCATDLGRAQVRNMLPSSDRAVVARELNLLSQMVALPAEPELGGVKDIGRLLSQAEAGAVLTAVELAEVRQTCTGLRLSRDFFKRELNCEGHLSAIARGLDVDRRVEEEIGRAIDESAAVRDSASPELHQLRDELRRRRNVLVERMERAVEDNPGWFEGGVMVRGERFVVPVRAEERSRVPGVVHASSGSGRTLFVEPIDTVTEQNRLQELRDAEKEEVQRILRRLSALIAGQVGELRRALDVAARLDVLLAKRRFALKFDCTRPVITDGAVKLLDARHPLLLDRRVPVVPLTFRLPDNARVVLISGPNAGGKTVVLKTVGLFSLLVGCGMFLPADEGTELPLFAEVFADIGDEQSLEQDLSSFTAHLVRLRDVIAKVGAESLVLLDEIGASTDPEEGAALAGAVLEVLRDRRALTLGTTHLGGLKLLAQGEPGMVNAAMEFRNGPTYRLVMGVPGESSALAIAERVGLQVEVVARARTRMGTNWLDISGRLETLSLELQRAAEARAAAERARQEAEQLCRNYQVKVSEYERFLAEEYRRVRAEQDSLLRETRREIENLVRRIREQRADRESVVAAKRYVESRLAEVAEPARPVEAAGAAPVAAGDVVESVTFRRQGTVVGIYGAEALVGFGQVKVRVPISDLVLVPNGSANRCREVVVDDYSFETRLDVRGMTCDEAGEAVRRFLDEAASAGAVQLTVVHGKGTGALRRTLWESLRRDGRVERMWHGEDAEGGSGVTFLNLRGGA